ncbi:pyrimidine-specific ribonucleoside hydrolase RihA-like [Drosophila busckii]|uniref:pyrimidine-specific ribonucleoside hydrolase RihA-like n=1 Tax=Drosophila busckii TaxID=30019 RepID=UPI00083F00C5|nr:pyrimidine-specific ribonucleoside hydrolase RihA-like [Drosophila busckii]
MEKSERYVVYDCDIGIDDAWALKLLLRAEEYSQVLSSPLAEEKFKVKAITCVRGNAEVNDTARNALRLLTTLKRLDVPVYKGSKEPIVPTSWKPHFDFHGKDGLGDVGDYPVVDEQALISQEHAVLAMYRLVCEHPGQVDFLLVGPLTNFAMCINLYGDAFLSKIGKVYIMGGNIYGKGNVTKSAEFNFRLDPEAAYIVLERLKSPAFILPWETCISEQANIALDWRWQVLGALQTDFVKLMNRAERKILIPRGFVNWLTCDLLLVAAYLFPSKVISQISEFYASVELNGAQTRGQMVLDHKKGKIVDDFHGKPVNLKIIQKVQAEHLKLIYNSTQQLKHEEEEKTKTK